ncbi:class I SAM-dependent methyltransferase [Candidatus Poribacteria bacterium]|nr:class I SAM-dependent methyltransferase [Candidatus Poribacteria bacterium]
MTMDLKELKRDIVFETQLRGFDFVFHSTYGLFSPKSIDEGTGLLIDNLEVSEGDVCLDLGCGYGSIGLVMAKLSRTGKVYMVDKDFVAVAYAQKNVKGNGTKNCEVLLSNAFSHLPEVKFDVIASNLPANAGKELLNIILLEAREHLNPNGKLYVVTISGLREYIKRNFTEFFGNYQKVKQGRNHTVGLAVRQKE